MNESKNLFSELFRKRSKYAYCFLLVQLIGAVFIAAWLVSSTLGNYTASPWKEFPVVYVLTIFITSFVLDTIYLAYSSSKVEKVNRSQTWRLAPVSDIGLYLANTLSALFSFIYLMILQVLIITVPEFVYDLFINDHQDFSNFVSLLQRVGIDRILETALMFVLVGAALYVTVSFLNFTSHSLAEFLPGTSSKLIVNLIRLVLIIVLSWIMIDFIDNVLPQMVGIFEGISHGINRKMIEELIIIFSYDIVIAGINLFLINRFVEAESNK
ncbi:hypothetical protein PT285_05975 [Lactobacillus sp. ESL0791]|uniref:hypothetical protein n=1 Tax=Lactobacillus sp. ESL0791 TaxID=2983234 RepID=UPI0023F72303|nr:hypothetical protein [Lactobacillus sp. ESL0791]MDF7638946.1 hypothetical protein [Lactobacillus sp. ESL0791]